MPAADPPLLEPLPARRVVATSSALDALTVGITDAGLGHVCLRLAPDELLVVADLAMAAADAVSADAAPADAVVVGAVLEHDPDAIDVVDAGWSGALVHPSVALDFLSWATTWSIGADRPVLLQGMAAGVPVKVWLPAGGPALVLVATPLAHDLQERWR